MICVRGGQSVISMEATAPNSPIDDPSLSRTLTTTDALRSISERSLSGRLFFVPNRTTSRMVTLYCFVCTLTLYQICSVICFSELIQTLTGSNDKSPL